MRLKLKIEYFTIFSSLLFCGCLPVQKEDPRPKAWRTKLDPPAIMQFDGNTDYFWILKTNKGTITIKLMPQIAPMHVTNTIYLTEMGYYDSLIFHRVIPGFMAQGGCPYGSGTGGPGYHFAGEFSPMVRHNKPYLLSMANSGPGTDGSQFFLTFVQVKHIEVACFLKNTEQLLVCYTDEENFGDAYIGIAVLEASYTYKKHSCEMSSFKTKFHLTIISIEIAIKAGIPTKKPTSHATPAGFPKLRVEPIQGVRLGTHVLESL